MQKVKDVAAHKGSEARVASKAEKAAAPGGTGARRCSCQLLRTAPNRLSTASASISPPAGFGGAEELGQGQLKAFVDHAPDDLACLRIVGDRLQRWMLFSLIS